MFSSRDKYDAGCGCTVCKPILTGNWRNRGYKLRHGAHGGNGKEIRRTFRACFPGPKEGEVFAIINGAALEFIPYEEMEKKGYEEYMVLCE